MSDMLGLNFVLYGDKELVNTFNKSPNIIGDGLYEAVDSLATSIAGNAKTFAPVKTGHLRRSITKAETLRSHDSIVGKVGTNVFYAIFQEFGTIYFAGRFFFTRALEIAKREAPRLLKDRLELITRDLSK